MLSDIDQRVYAPFGNQIAWRQYIKAGDTMGPTLQKHGWTVTGFEMPAQYYFSYGGIAYPPAAAAKWVVGPNDLGGLKVALLDDPEIVEAKI